MMNIVPRLVLIVMLVLVPAFATATINRKDFGLTWNTLLETGGVAVGDEVKIAVDIELIQK